MKSLQQRDHKIREKQQKNSDYDLFAESIGVSTRSSKKSKQSLSPKPQTSKQQKNAKKNHANKFSTVFFLFNLFLLLKVNFL